MNKAHILIVEDNDGDILLISEVLETSVIIEKISIATDGKQAIDFLNKEGIYEEQVTPDLILLEINLPLKNGHEVLKTIKDNSKLKHIPVIMFTTSSSQSDINRSYQEHANCYLTKPVEITDYTQLVRSIEDFWFKRASLPQVAFS